MKIKKAYCFFEQSGTFKNEFIKLGIPAEDYDIQNNFGETDNIIDLFAEIEKGYANKSSIFDKITKDDLIMAFFPCTYFAEGQMTFYSLNSVTNQKLSIVKRIDEAIERLKNRTYYHELLYKMIAICYSIGLCGVIENPYHGAGYLYGIQNFPKPTLIDRNRMLRGDFFKKPTAYWFINIKPTYGFSLQKNKKPKKINNLSGGKKGMCSVERSMISDDYARNFICDFIIGKEQNHSLRSLFD